MIPLPDEFLTRPLAHRGYHGRDRPENSWPACEAAIDAGYGIELDVQMSSDGHAVVFHDDTLHRMTAKTGPVNALTLKDLSKIELNGEATQICSLTEILERVAGRTPVLVEIKDQSGTMGPTDQMLEASVASACAGRSNVAVMSFNPHAVAAMGRLSPDVPRGLTTSAFDPRDWIGLSPDTCNRLRGIPDYNATGSSFVSHQAADLGRARVGELKADGAAILCWTIRSREREARARTVAHNITFEGYAAPVPTG